jgi:hypothetical protein
MNFPAAETVGYCKFNQSDKESGPFGVVIASEARQSHLCPDNLALERITPEVLYYKYGQEGAV